MACGTVSLSHHCHCQTSNCAVFVGPKKWCLLRRHLCDSGIKLRHRLRLICHLVVLHMRTHYRRIGPLSPRPFAQKPLLALLFVLCFCHIDGFAKKKSARGNPAGSSSPKGFGLPPQSLQDVLSKLPSRMPPDSAMVDCPCGSGKSYADCCGPLHDRSRLCESMIDVLRSRYSAFCWRNIGHIIVTTHPTNRDYSHDKAAWARDLHKEGMFDSFEFVKLDVGKIELGASENEGFIEFQVTMRGRGQDDVLRNNPRRSAATVTGLETIVKERSRFLRDRETGEWSYASGDVTSEVAGLQSTKLNL